MQRPLLPLSSASLETPLAIQHVVNDRLQIGSATPGDARSITYRNHAGLPKPGFHPLVTPRGHVLTGWEMSDHGWHRGLWFAIKFVNEDNFWEEQPPFGRQVTHITPPLVEAISPGVARMTHKLQWVSPEGAAVLEESRSVRANLRHDGITVMDWETSLRALRAVLLDRTPFTTWGGYGGFSLRASREMHEVSFDLPDGKTVPSISGVPHPWVLMRGRMDGGTDEWVSLCLVDHPDNPVAPVPWYAKSANGFTFINAAFLFHGALKMRADEVLRFRYRLLYRDGCEDVGRIVSLAADFRNNQHITKRSLKNCPELNFDTNL